MTNKLLWLKVRVPLQAWKRIQLRNDLSQGRTLARGLQDSLQVTQVCNIASQILCCCPPVCLEQR